MLDRSWSGRKMEQRGLSDGIQKIEVTAAKAAFETGTETIDQSRPNVSKPTLTDHLNKKLLNSFLTRINEGSVAVPNTQKIGSSQKQFD